jgi:hypothetical protein
LTNSLPFLGWLGFTMIITLFFFFWTIQAFACLARLACCLPPVRASAHAGRFVL